MLQINIVALALYLSILTPNLLSYIKTGFTFIVPKFRNTP